MEKFFVSEEKKFGRIDSKSIIQSAFDKQTINIFSSENTSKNHYRTFYNVYFIKGKKLIKKNIFYFFCQLYKEYKRPSKILAVNQRQKF